MQRWDMGTERRHIVIPLKRGREGRGGGVLFVRGSAVGSRGAS